MKHIALAATLGIAAAGVVYAFASDPPMRAVDGDTLRVGTESIRLQDFDAPETFDSRCEEEHALGVRARERLAVLAADPTARLHRNGKDRYGRTLARMGVGDRAVAAIMVEEGLAAPYLCTSDGRCPRRPDWCARLGARR